MSLRLVPVAVLAPTYVPPVTPVRPAIARINVRSNEPELVIIPAARETMPPEVRIIVAVKESGETFAACIYRTRTYV